MNFWECSTTGCGRTAYGTGGAIGLQAVGWWFKRGENGFGPTLYCPAHRPDGPPCAGKCGTTLPMRTADAEAVGWQQIMGSDIETREHDEHIDYCSNCCPRCSSSEVHG